MIIGWIFPESRTCWVLCNRRGTCFISCSWSPNIVSPAHMSTVVYSPGWTVFHRIGSCKRGYVPSAAGGFPSGVPRSAACPNSSEDIHKPEMIQISNASSKVLPLGIMPSPFSFKVRVSSTEKLFPSIAQLCAENKFHCIL